MAYNIKNPKVKEKKFTEEDDLFKVPKLDDEKETSLFKEDEKETINEINDDLYSNETPIEIQDKSTLLIKASGETHKITRKDFAEYQKRYGYEGQDGKDMSGFRELGTIQGDWRPIDNIAQDVASISGRIDERLRAYGTSINEE